MSREESSPRSRKVFLKAEYREEYIIEMGFNEKILIMQSDTIRSSYNYTNVVNF